MPPSDPMESLSFWVKSSYTDIKKLPLSCMYQSMLKCWYEAASAGTRQMLFSMGQKYYTQLLSEEARMQRRLSKCGMIGRFWEHDVFEYDGASNRSMNIVKFMMMV